MFTPLLLHIICSFDVSDPDYVTDESTEKFCHWQSLLCTTAACLCAKWGRTFPSIPG